MGMLDRLKSLAGGHKTLATIASGTTTAVPESDGAFYVSGSATITSLTTPNYCRNRQVTFIGAASASVTFTHTVGSTTAGQMDLGAQSIVLSAKDVLVLFCNENGVWQLVSYKQNNAVSVSLASATTVTLPDHSDFFVVTGTATISTINATTTGKWRRVTFIGAASANVTFSNNNSPSSGQMYLRGTSRTILEDYVLVLLLNPDGTWTLQSST